MATVRQQPTRFVGFAVTDVTKIASDLRLVKTPYERKVLAKSFEISNEAQLAGVRAAQPGAYEYEVKAAIVLFASLLDAVIFFSTKHHRMRISRPILVDHRHKR